MDFYELELRLASHKQRTVTGREKAIRLWLSLYVRRGLLMPNHRPHRSNNSVVHQSGFYPSR